MGKKVLIVVVAVAFLASVTGCASIFYPSRVGQKSHGGVDVGMLLLDIFLTGLIGVVVDLITGAIFFPSSYCLPAPGDVNAGLHDLSGLQRGNFIEFPRQGAAEFTLPVCAADGTSHDVSLIIVTETGHGAARCSVDFTGTSLWEKVGSKLEIAAGDAARGFMRVLIDGEERAELPVRFVDPRE